MTERSSNEELPLLPELPIVDPHHHLWDRGGERYLAEELRADLDCGHRFIATGYVECRSRYRKDGPDVLRPIGETAFVAQTLASPLTTTPGPVMAGAAIIAFADLSLGEAVAEVLEAHRSVACDRLRGVRYSVAWHAGAAIRSHYPTVARMLALPDVRAGIRQLGKAGLVFDSWSYFTQLNEVASAADACSDTVFVVDHCGGPVGIGPWADRREEAFRIWRAGVQALAQRQNVRMKLGGLGMPLAGFAFHKRAVPPSSTDLADAWRPYIDVCIEAFGPARCMFESNWPVDRTAGNYGTIWNAFKRLAREGSQAEHADLFAATASRTYSIAGPLG